MSRALATGLLLCSGLARAQSPAELVQSIDVDEHLGAQVPLSLRFTDDTGRAVRLADYFADGKPVILALVYFNCPSLCGLVLHGEGEALGKLGGAVDYRTLTVSIDPKDRPEGAKVRKERLLTDLRRPTKPEEWPFLTGDEASIRALARTVGFRYVQDPRTGQFAHPAVLIVLTPSGRVARYLYGVEFPPLDVRFALTEAQQNRASMGPRLLLTCYRWDPATRRYGFYIAGFMKLGGVVILLSVAAMVAALHRRGRRRERG